MQLNTLPPYVPSTKNPIQELEEMSQKCTSSGFPIELDWRVKEYGVAHQRLYYCEVWARHNQIGQGKSHSKQDAKTIAAQQAVQSYAIVKLLKNM